MDIAQLGISVDSRQVKTARDELGRFVSTGNQAEKATSGVTSATQAFGSALASLGIAAATSQLIKMADTYGLLQSKIGLATGEMTKAAEATDMVFAAAQRARVGVDELGNMVAKLAPSIRDMGGTTADAVAASELFGKTLKISGASAAEASSAILQFGQALGTGRLGGEEFNAVNESSGRYMQLLAKELGVTRGELKKMAEDGKLTGDVLINALANNATTLESEFAQLRVTGADAMEQLKNSTMQAAFEIDNATGVSQTFGGVLNAGRGVIDAVTLALRDTNTEASNSGVIIPTATAVFQSLGVAAAETVYVFRETGRTLGALAAQAAALAQGDLDLFRRIGEERDRDSVAARASVDKLTASILASETASAKLATTAPKLSTGLKVVATSSKDADKAAKAAARAAAQAADAYGDLERSLSKQLMTEQELTTEQRVSMDLTDKRYKNLSDKQKANLIALAKEVDAFKARQKLLGEIATAAQALSDSITKSQQAEIDAAYAAAKATEDQLAKLMEEADTYGMTESQIQQYLLAKAEEKLALEKGGDARQGVIDQIEREIEARRKLVSVAQGGEARKAADDMGGAVQKSLADAVRAGLEADNPIKGFAQSLGNAVKNALYNAVANGLAARITGALGFGGVSGGAMASGGGSDIFSLGSSAKSMYDIISGASVGNAASGALQSFSTSSMGQYFGLSDAAGNLTQAGADLTVQVGNFADAASQYGGYAKAAYDVFNAFKEGKDWGAAAGSAIGSYWGAPGAFIGNKIGGLVDSAFSGGGGQKFGGEGAIGRATAGLFPEGQTDAQVQSALDTFGTGVQDIVKKLGGSLSGLQYAYGYETDPQGTAGNFFSSQLSVGGKMLRDINVQQYTGEASDQMAKEFKTATVLALQKANLSADLQTAFEGFDPAIEGAADKVLARLEQIKAVSDAFDQLGKVMPNLSGLSLEAKESLLALAGGSEQLAAGLASYYEAFYTEAERTQLATEQLTKQFLALGVTMPDSAEAFRKLVESQDLSTESGRQLYAQLMSLSGAFSQSAQAAQAAAAAAQSAQIAVIRASQSNAQDALGVLQQSVDAEKAAIQQRYDAERAAILSTQSAAVSAYDSAAEAVRSNAAALLQLRDTLIGTADDMANATLTLARRQAAIADLIGIQGKIAGGQSALSFADELQSAMTLIQRPSENLYSSFEDYAYDQGRATGYIRATATATETQASVAEMQLTAIASAARDASTYYSQQLEKLDEQYQLDISALDETMDIATQQLNALLGIDGGIKSVADALAALRGAMAMVSTVTNNTRAADINSLYNDVLGRNADASGLQFYLNSGKSLEQIRADLQYAALHGSHKNGLAEVPFDGYRAELHAGERVLTAQQADSSDKMAIDLAEMKAEMKAALYAIADNTRRTARLQERWDGDGLPDARGY